LTSQEKTQRNSYSQPETWAVCGRDKAGVQGFQGRQCPNLLIWRLTS
jgi:hypothetical protein